MATREKPPLGKSKPTGAAEQVRRRASAKVTVKAAGELRKEAQPVLARLKARTATLRTNQSQLVQWLHVNFDQFSAIVDGGQQPGWKAIADELTAAGLTKKDGRELTEGYVRLAWFKVKRAHMKARSANAAVEGPPAPRQRPAGYKAKPFQMPSVLADWTATDVSRGTNQDDDPPTNPMGEKI